MTVPNEGERLVTALTAAGFPLAGRGRGYARFGWPGDEWPHGSLMVPLDPTAPEYEVDYEALRIRLLDAVERGEQARQALAGLDAASVEATHD